MAASWRTTLFGGLKRIRVGTDLKGNTYFEIPQEGARPRRVVDLKTPTRQGTDYDADALPVEWTAWLRYRRHDPPTLEELQANEQYRAAVKARAAALSQEQQAAMLQIQAEEVRIHAAAVAALAQPTETPASPWDAAAAPADATPASTAPKGKGEDFQPGEWVPKGARRDA